MTEKSKTEHRQRLRDNFLSGDAESRSDKMILELLLTFAIGHKDVKPLAGELMRIFGSLSQVLSASQDELAKVKGLGRAPVSLIKAVDFIAAGENRQKLSQNIPNVEEPDHSSSNLHKKLPAESVPSSVSDRKPVLPVNEQALSVSPHVSKPSKKKITTSQNTRRKFQVSNGYLLEFDQLARILHFLLENREAKKINRRVLQENTGLADRQVESLISIGSAMGLIKPGNQVLTPTGLLLAEHDIFIERTGSLEWCHYVGAGSFRNLIWFEIFNHLLPQASPMTQEEWTERFRSDLAGKYSKRTISKSLYEEVRFVIDAYMQRNFNKLELLRRSSEERLYRLRYTRFSPLVLSAMIYDFCASKETHLFQVAEMAVTSGSPAVVFGLDVASFRQQIEELHDRGWLRYETTHNLDQIRLKQGFTAIRFLSAFYEDRDPREDPKPSLGGIFQ